MNLSERRSYARDNRGKMNSYVRKWRKKNKTLLDEYKMRRGCSRCGYAEHPSALDLHHTSPEDKKFSIAAKINNHPFESLIDEIEKCDVLCANCHRIIHQEGDNEPE